MGGSSRLDQAEIQSVLHFAKRPEELFLEVLISLQMSSLQQGFQQSSTLVHSQMNNAKNFSIVVLVKCEWTGPAVGKAVCLSAEG